jgi:hypothetical protein
MTTIESSFATEDCADFECPACGVELGAGDTTYTNAPVHAEIAFCSKACAKATIEQLSAYAAAKNKYYSPPEARRWRTADAVDYAAAQGDGEAPSAEDQLAIAWFAEDSDGTYLVLIKDS